MKKKVVLILLLVISMTTLVAAGVFFGSFIIDSFSVVDPSNMLHDAPPGPFDYALLEFHNNGQCPGDDFTVTPKGGCKEIDSGQAFRPWAIIGFNNSNGSLITGADAVRVKASNKGDGCSGQSCTAWVLTKVFTTSNFSGNSTEWDFSGNLLVPFNQTITENVTLSDEDVDAVLVSKGHGSDARPDLRVHWVQVLN